MIEPASDPSRDENPRTKAATPATTATGFTSAERYLYTLARQSFLSAWSYPNVFRDQGRTASGADGKEVCDLLVVFERDVIIFSDKDVRFPDSGNLNLDWSRWFRRAILASAKQVWGAERWISQHPDRLFLDPACTIPFPIPLPQADALRFHRVVVAHDGARRCREVLGGSGSLMLVPNIVGDAHTGDEAQPFMIGQLDATKGFVHVLDDTTLDILLSKLDTISDFVAYLVKKELFVQSGRLGFAAGEEELLAFYLKHVNAEHQHDFVVAQNVDHITLQEGLWSAYEANPQRLAQKDADEVSYLWDALIERFSHHAANNTQHFTTHPGLGIAGSEPALRFLARENRTYRRVRARGLIEVMGRAKGEEVMVRVFAPVTSGDACFVLLAVAQRHDLSYVRYRTFRRQTLEAYCQVAKLHLPEALDIVGIGVGALDDESMSEDLLYLDTREWGEAEEAEARDLQNKLGLLTRTKGFAVQEQEYPPVGPRRRPHSAPRAAAKGRDRNRPCSCGSGRKLKKCCGR